MANEALNVQRAQQSMGALSNAVELSALVINEVMGNDVADSLNGSRLTLQALRMHAANRIRLNLNKKP